MLVGIKEGHHDPIAFCPIARFSVKLHIMPLVLWMSDDSTEFR